MINNTKYIQHLKDFLIHHSKFVTNGIFPDYINDVKVDDSIDFLVYNKDYDPFGNKIIKEKILNDRLTHWSKNIQV